MALGEMGFIVLGWGEGDVCKFMWGVCGGGGFLLAV